MGLDMFVYRIKKVSETEATLCNDLFDDEISNLGYSLFYELDDDRKHMISEIMPYLRPVRYLVKALDMNKIKKAYHIPDCAAPCGAAFTPNEIAYSFYWGEGDERKSSRVPISRDEATQFEVTLEKNGFLARMEECAYWRKDYALCEKIGEMHGMAIENCGYYVLSETELHAISQYCESIGEPVTFPVCADNEALIYHEWY